LRACLWIRAEEESRPLNPLRTEGASSHVRKKITVKKRGTVAKNSVTMAACETTRRVVISLGERDTAREGRYVGVMGT